MATESEWFPIVAARCDICNRIAKWRHPMGGYRCGSCPRPNAKVDPKVPPCNNPGWHAIACGCD